MNCCACRDDGCANFAADHHWLLGVKTTCPFSIIPLVNRPIPVWPSFWKKEKFLRLQGLNRSAKWSHLGLLCLHPTNTYGRHWAREISVVRSFEAVNLAMPGGRLMAQLLGQHLLKSLWSHFIPNPHPFQEWTNPPIFVSESLSNKDLNASYLNGDTLEDVRNAVPNVPSVEFQKLDSHNYSSRQNGEDKRREMYTVALIHSCMRELTKLRSSKSYGRFEGQDSRNFF